jgi:acyl-homoserine lactone acylase PvdQ
MTTTRVRPEECLSRIDGEVRVKGLDATVRIVRDSWGIPHIKASSLVDAIFGQGYAIAQDRLFQLELRRHQARGATAAFINKGFLAQDRANRRTGLARLAETEWEAQSAESRRSEAYSAGVNAGIATQPRRSVRTAGPRHGAVVAGRYAGDYEDGCRGQPVGAANPARKLATKASRRC